MLSINQQQKEGKEENVIKLWNQFVTLEQPLHPHHPLPEQKEYKIGLTYIHSFY